MSDQSKAGRLKHAAALLALAITELDRGDQLESDEHARQASDKIFDSLMTPLHPRMPA